jgi:hypothetical protein
MRFAQVPEGLPKVARQFYWRVAAVVFESSAVGMVEIGVRRFRRPSGTRVCFCVRDPGVGNAGLLSDVPHSAVAFAPAPVGMTGWGRAEAAIA